MNRKIINDGLTRTERHRLKDLDAYRKRKRDWAKSESQKKYRREYMAKWKIKNPERVLELARNTYHKNKHKYKDRNLNIYLIAKYGITLEQKKEMFLEQDSKCLICSNEILNSRQIHVDHDHKTNKIRGILCGSCNTKLGWYEKHKDQITKYLK